MRMCEPEGATENVWHVLDVLEDSPAESAGLVPMGDWILGWSGGVLSAENDFYDLVEAVGPLTMKLYLSLTCDGSISINRYAFMYIPMTLSTFVCSMVLYLMLNLLVH